MDCNTGDTGDRDLIPVSGRPLEQETAAPLQYSCLGKPMDGKVYWAVEHGVIKSQT